MRSVIALLCSLLVAACATAPMQSTTEKLFNDHLFVAPSESINAAEVFAVSDAMKRYIGVDIAGELRAKGSQQGLVDALYHKGQLKLEYDSALTRNAAQAFDARAGNCLSLVIMTAALAKELGLPVRYQNVVADDTWSRTGDIYFSIGHVNLALGKKKTDVGPGRNESEVLVIDFLPATDIRARTRVLAESTIVAMYMNNRAVETFTDGQLNDAYWWAREAIRQDPKFLSAYNTLGVVYQRRGHFAEADRVFAHVLEREPANTRVMSNRVAVFTHGPGIVFNTKRPITSVADLSGLKFRIGGGMVNGISKALGMNVTLKPAPESYELLSTGVMDGTLFPAESVESFKIDKVIKYATTFPGGLYNTAFVFMMNQAKYDSLPPDVKKVVDEMSGEFAARMIGKGWDKVDRRGMAFMQAAGVQFSKADAAFVKDVNERTGTLVDTWAKAAEAKGMKDPKKALADFRAEIKKLEK